MVTCSVAVTRALIKFSFSFNGEKNSCLTITPSISLRSTHSRRAERNQAMRKMWDKNNSGRAESGRIFLLSPHFSLGPDCSRPIFRAARFRSARTAIPESLLSRLPFDKKDSGNKTKHFKYFNKKKITVHVKLRCGLSLFPRVPLPALIHLSRYLPSLPLSPYLSVPTSQPLP